MYRLKAKTHNKDISILVTNMIIRVKVRVRDKLGEIRWMDISISSLFYYCNIYRLLYKSPPYTDLLHNTPPQVGAYNRTCPACYI